MIFANTAYSQGIVALLTLLLYLVSIALAWYTLGAVKWDLFLHRPQGGRASALRLLLAIGIGFLLAQFVLAYIQSTLLMKSSLG